jgi:N-acetylmuramic acid 6-phosphate etherase
MKKTSLPLTETASHYDNLEKMRVRDLLVNINREDKTVPLAVEKAIPAIERLVIKIVSKMKQGGRLFYVGAGTSGRLGIVDASECPPTFGVEQGLVIGLIAGGDSAIRKAVEFAEDDTQQGWKDLKKYKISTKDVVIGIAASGATPYVVAALEQCRKNKILTGSVCCTKNAPLSKVSDNPIELLTGPEFFTGSTRMKAGTAQKLALNMISTSVMIQLGRIKGNRMVDMQLSNNKLVKRGTRMIVSELGISADEAKKMLLKEGSVRKALQMANSRKPIADSSKNK